MLSTQFSVGRNIRHYISSIEILKWFIVRNLVEILHKHGAGSGADKTSIFRRELTCRKDESTIISKPVSFSTNPVNTHTHLLCLQKESISAQ